MYAFDSSFSNRSIGGKTTNGHTYYWDGVDITTGTQNYDVSFSLTEQADMVTIEIYSSKTWYLNKWYDVTQGSDSNINLPDNSDVLFQIRVDYDEDPGTSTCGTWSSTPPE